MPIGGTYRTTTDRYLRPNRDRFVRDLSVARSVHRHNREMALHADYLKRGAYCSRPTPDAEDPKAVTA